MTEATKYEQGEQATQRQTLRSSKSPPATPRELRSPQPQEPTTALEPTIKRGPKEKRTPNPDATSAENPTGMQRHTHPDCQGSRVQHVKNHGLTEQEHQQNSITAPENTSTPKDPQARPTLRHTSPKFLHATSTQDSGITSLQVNGSGSAAAKRSNRKSVSSAP